MLPGDGLSGVEFESLPVAEPESLLPHSSDRSFSHAQQNLFGSKKIWMQCGISGFFRRSFRPPRNGGISGGGGGSAEVAVTAAATRTAKAKSSRIV